VANVICRPELYGSPTREQYNEFHAGMKQLGLVQTITRGEYLGVNMSTSFNLLALNITALAIRITGRQCKLTLTPVEDPAKIYILGLEEDTSYESTLGAFASLFFTPPPKPTYSGFSALAELASSQRTPPQATGIPASLQFGFLTGMK
jgi:hypothetical protein